MVDNAESLEPVVKGYTLLKSLPDTQHYHEHEKVLHFVRHAEGHHNVAASPYTRGSEGYLRALAEFQWYDSRLSAKGESQCAALREAVRGLDYDLILVSPLTRTLQTATLAFAREGAERNHTSTAGDNRKLDEQNVPWLAHEAIRERFGRNPCDNRRNVAELSAEFKHVDFSLVATDVDPNPCSPDDCGQVEPVNSRE